MAPPRQRATAVIDDSRSEASSGTRENKSVTGSKGRKAVNGSLAATSVGSREGKAVANVTSAPAQEADPDERPRIPWSDMPLDILHAYRHAYKLPTSSAFSRPSSRLYLSCGIGLRSPTAISAQRATAKRTLGATNGLVNGRNKPSSLSQPRSVAASSSAHESLARDQLNHIIGQGRVGKDQLALAVRKHFNSAALAEQEAIARFLYKVREEGRGRQFRLRFQP
ncbi:hypothetical protein ASPZODRAFT_76384 [Penicilliopsis zonata CBS 506.65]|uniref:Histone deacetylase complex subunit SAP30 Sin3 binding domain-containing protein n=1 Tax=Penicilliopsis zonata CBS 506.65 TaxID=1073090 RepID=A0A1L9S6C0_9EURO|nr:hypothetical protein ASPZODRAFT_76384 [Penicilliopsis zonata CBS 506.65]OJJ42714.1 hypothetical protein ASPZODRAFT_76384 [Penicilliopsis zonata CBS 506.65]